MMAILTAVPVATSARTLGIEMYSTVLTGGLVQKINTEKIYDPVVMKKIEEHYQTEIKSNRFTESVGGKNIPYSVRKFTKYFRQQGIQWSGRSRLKSN